MATSEKTPDVKKRKERASNQQETRTENSLSTPDHVQKSRTKWPILLKKLVDPREPLIRKWNLIFILSCVFGVLLDPLFLYIPIINDDIKCLRSDNHLKMVALVSRSATDLSYLLNIFFHVYSRSRIGFLKILIDILAVLPIPQISILVFYFNIRGSRSFRTRKLIIMNFFVLVQYVPRVLRIYISCKEYSKKSFRKDIPIWLKGVLNFFLYILASHVIGAFWYFFAVQQLTTCWLYACRPENGCVPNNLYCHDHHPLMSINFLDEMCSVDPTNDLFNFGIFLDILQLRILGPTNYVEKFSNCFGWGLRNLSSFGSNLKPSTNAWENLFAAFISIIGLLLFLYLIGNLQAYMQLDTTNSIETHLWKIRIEKKMEEKGRDVEQWLSKNGIPSCEKSEIMTQVEVELRKDKDRDVDVENILSILPSERRRYMRSCMPLNRLKKVSLLHNMNEEVLKEISEYLEPKKYRKNEIIIREKEPLDMMVFIVEGLVIIEMRDCSRTLNRSAGQVYGEKLLSWPAWTSFPFVLPVATESVRADGDVEALVLMANDMKDLGSKFRPYFLSKGITRLTDDEWELLESDWVTMLKNVLKLKTTNNRVVKAISENLKPMKCEGNFIILEGQPLRMMVFATRGSLSLKKDGAWTSEKHQFYGHELLHWVLNRSFPAVLPISTHGVWVHFNTDILVLTAKDLGGVVSNFKSYFSMEITSLTDDSSLDLCATVGFTWLKKGPSIFQRMDEEVLKIISKHLKLMTYDVDTYIVQENKPLEYMLIFVDGSSMSIESSRHRFERGLCDIGEFFGEELVHWVTYWATHATFPDKLPLSTSNVKVCTNNTGYARVFVLWADDLKNIVFKLRSQFIKQTTIPVNIEGKISTSFDPLATLKKVPKLEVMDEIILEKFCTKLIPTRYNDVSPYIIEGELDKMFLIVSGLVSIRSIKGGEKVYRYSGNYCGDELFEWALHPSRAYNHSLLKSDVCVEAVGDVEALILKANDLIRLVLELKFLEETGDDDIDLFVQKKKTSMQLDTTKKGKEDETRKARIEKKKAGREVEWWLTKNGIPTCKQSEIMEKVLGELEENKDVDVENILSILPLDLQSYMKSCMPLNRLKQVPLLQNFDEDVLRAISEYIVPKKYTKNEIIIREKEPLQMMIFIVEGCIIIKGRDFPSTLKRSAGEVYGEKLLSWPAWTSFPDYLPVATESVRADSDVEALVLMARDMEDVGRKFRSYFSSKEIAPLIDDEWKLLESEQVTMLRKVPKLLTMDTQVLQAISENLKPMSCKTYINIIREGKPLRKMVFVTGGSISLKKDGAWTNEKRQFYGEELLDWVLDSSFPAIVPISTHGVWVHFNTDILVLTANDLGGVISNFKSHFSKEITSPTDDSSLDLCAIVGLTWLKKGPSIFRRMDEEMLKVISKHLKLMSYSMNSYVIRENKPLEYMFIFVEGCSMSIESTRRPIERGLHNIGKIYGEKLVHWVTNWASHATFPNKLPLSTSNVKLSIDDTGNARVLVLWANDLKKIVSKFRWQSSEWQLSTFDPLAILKNVPQLGDMDQEQLEKIRDRLICKRYNDMSPYIIEGEFDKMFLIVSGLVSITSTASVEKVYYYSGNYCGDELVKRALHPSRASKSIVWVEAVGEVEALVIEADDLIRLVSEFNHSRGFWIMRTGIIYSKQRIQEVKEVWRSAESVYTIDSGSSSLTNLEFELFEDEDKRSSVQKPTSVKSKRGRCLQNVRASKKTDASSWMRMKAMSTSQNQSLNAHQQEMILNVQFHSAAPILVSRSGTPNRYGKLKLPRNLDRKKNVQKVHKRVNKDHTKENEEPNRQHNSDRENTYYFKNRIEGLTKQVGAIDLGCDVVIELKGDKNVFHT